MLCTALECFLFIVCVSAVSAWARGFTFQKLNRCGSICSIGSRETQVAAFRPCEHLLSSNDPDVAIQWSTDRVRQYWLKQVDWIAISFSVTSTQPNSERWIVAAKTFTLL